MRLQKEVEERINKVEAYLEMSKEFGKFNSNERNKLNKEISVLNWVLGDKIIQKEVIPFQPVKDQIVSYLREQTTPKTTSEIIYALNKPEGSLSTALRTLSKEKKIERTGESRRYSYSVKQ